jgi:serine/threonine protein kinase
MPLSEGAQFAGYTLVRLLGSGGMGEVYLARHPRFPRHEALKVLRADLSADPDFQQRFNREAELASGLWHPHIVGVHDRGEFDGQLWITMDYVDGLDLGALVSTHYSSGMPVEGVHHVTPTLSSASAKGSSNVLLSPLYDPWRELVNGSACNGRSFVRRNRRTAHSRW